ncbi:hypothetical protein N9T10_03585 [Pseudomonadota bacterium]|jgi:hypothetical protein|nr:hypothetical protein [Pseudomonadota bacterium]
MISILRNFPVVLHQLFFLIAQLLILKICGIKYSGSLAYIGAVSTFLAVLINLRWDIEILISKSQKLHESLLDASTSIVLMASIVILLNFIFGAPFQLHIIFSALAISIHEVLVAILFVQKRILIYSLFRTIPAIALACFALIGFGPEIIWPLSYFLSAFFLFVYFRGLFKRAFYGVTIDRIKSIKIMHKMNAVATATAFSFCSALIIIAIKFYFGDEYVGLWSNTIRIFNSLIIFLLSASLPFALNRLSNNNLQIDKVKTFFYLWLSFLPLVALFVLLISQYGTLIFSLFLPLSFDITNTHLNYIFLIGVAISFIGSSQGLYQAMHKSIILLAMIVTSAIIGFICIYNMDIIFTQLIVLFLFLIFTLVCMILLHLALYLISNNGSSNKVI